MTSTEVELVSDVQRCRQVVEGIVRDAAKSKAKEGYAIAVDLEGKRIGPPEGVLAIVTIGTPDGKVYLFDIAAMQQDAFTEGLLKPLLESSEMTKIWFDCRMDVTELFKHGVCPRRVVDLQVSAVKHFAPNGTYLMGLAKTLEKLKLSSPSDELVKKAGHELFAPDAGGSYDVWFQRPLLPTMTAYAVVDVKHLFAVRHIFLDKEQACLTVSAARVAKWSCAVTTHGDHMKYKDF